MSETAQKIQISSSVGTLTLLKGERPSAISHIDTLARLYERDFVSPDTKNNYEEIFNKERFQRMLLEKYSVRPNFQLITLWHEKELVGFVYGSSLPQETLWWSSVKKPLSKDFTAENGARTLALYDMCVKKEYRGHGLGSLLHEQLIEGQNNERVTLLSEKKLQPAYSIWQHWGYKSIGTVTPKGTTATLEVFIRAIN